MYEKFNWSASLNSFLLKISIEIRNVWFVFLYRDVDKYGHAGIWFLTKMYQFIVSVNNNHKN